MNFFLEEEHLGGFRAQHTCNLLKELNPDVQGHFITEVERPSRNIIARTNKGSPLNL